MPRRVGVGAAAGTEIATVHLAIKITRSNSHAPPTNALADYFHPYNVGPDRSVFLSPKRTERYVRGSER